jgi:hypothetical protein
MDFFLDELNKILPQELTEQRKGRLQEGLKQFTEEFRLQDKYYPEFYLNDFKPFFLQGDLIRELRFPIFNRATGEYEKLYYDSLLISNTCDVDEANKRKIPKRAILAKVIPFDAFVKSLDSLKVEDASNILTQVKNQQYSNLLYLPQTKDKVDYLAYFDDLSIVEVEELTALKEDITHNRIESLDIFGYYLFIFKLSFHFCRLPEETER